MSSYDIAICYFGLPRSVKYVYESHQKYIYDVLDDKCITYKKFMHSIKLLGFALFLKIRFFATP